mmetsp:Transcript_8132/g.19152  ORF Transcript_8132/g.19152 Transcript_8132/m.19152 type:complete len:227 (+) Transcript_8132:259-939(+)
MKRKTYSKMLMKKGASPPARTMELSTPMAIALSAITQPMLKSKAGVDTTLAQYVLKPAFVFIECFALRTSYCWMSRVRRVVFWAHPWERLCESWPKLFQLESEKRFLVTNMLPTLAWDLSDALASQEGSLSAGPPGSRRPSLSLRSLGTSSTRDDLLGRASARGSGHSITSGTCSTSAGSCGSSRMSGRSSVSGASGASGAASTPSCASGGGGRTSSWACGCSRPP